MAVQARTQPRTPIIPNQSRTAITSNGMSFTGAEIVAVLKSIQSSVLQIESIVASTLVLQKKQEDTDRRNREKQERAKKENRLEQTKTVNPVAFLKDSLPRMGLIDTIRNFILYTFMGFAVPKLIKFLPQVLRIVQFIDPFIKLTENFVGAVFNNLIKTIDFSYDAYDKVKGVVKSIGGENLEKQFESLSSNLNTFLNTAIIVGLAIAGSGEFGGGRRGRGFTGVGGRGGVGGAARGVNTRIGQYLNRTRSERFIERRYGYDASRMYRGRIEQGGSRERALADVRSRFAPRTPAAGLAGAGRTPGAIGARGLGRVTQRAGIKLFGKTTGRFFGRVPIIGPLLDFGISIALGEDPGRAGAGAVGAFVGGSLGSLIPIPGVGTIAGSFLGDFIGRSLYDAVTTTRNQNKIEKKAKGGRVSAGKPIRKAPVRRAPKKEKPINKITIPSKTPIKEIEKKFSKLQLQYFETSNQIYQRNDRLFGPFASLSIKALKGEKPDNTTIRKMSENFGIVVDNIVQNQTRKNLFAAANGGTVPITREIGSKKTVGETFSDLMYGTAVSMFNKGVNETLQRLKGIKETIEPTGPGDGEEVPPAHISDDQRKAADDLIKYFKDLYGENAAIGIVANLLRESGLRTSTPDNSRFEGMAQWSRNDRWTKFVSWAQSKGKDPYSRSAQAEWIVVELKQLGTDSRLKKASSPEEAASLFYNEFERAAYSRPIMGNKYNPDNPHERKNRGFIASLTGKPIEYVAPDKNIKIKVTSRRGWRWGRMHEGSDIAADSGTPLRAISDGHIVDAGTQPGGGWGNFVVFKDNKGIYHLYGHVQNGFRKSGAIKKGDIIARVGTTGDVTGPHLHWETGTGWDGGNVTGRFDPLDRYSQNAPFFTDKKPESLTSQNKPQPPQSGRVIRSFKVGDFVYTEREGGRYTQNSKPIEKSLFDTVVKNHPQVSMKTSPSTANSVATVSKSSDVAYATQEITNTDLIFITT